MKFDIPSSLRGEHRQLHDFLAAAGKEPGELGESARLVARLLEPHMHKEESFALPPLALLPQLARGKLSREMAEVFAYTDWLKAHLEDMLAEHRVIVAALERLIAAAREQGRVEYAEFAQKLVTHTRMEEQVMYPAAILVGEFLRLKTRLPRPRTVAVGNAGRS
jgi:hypothetical protein